MAAKAVLFDYGNVLVRWDPRNLYRQMFADPAEMERFLGEVCTMDWHAQFDAGQPFAPAVAALSARHPEHAAHIAAWEARFGDMLGGVIEGSAALVDRLAGRGVPMALLTNMPADKQAVCFAPLDGRLDVFSAVVVSGVEKLAKPDPAVYRLALARMGGFAPEEVLFVDDSPRNVAGAAAAGLKAHLFENPQALEAALAAEGLLG